MGMTVKLTWHDILKDPNDLPENENAVIATVIHDNVPYIAANIHYSSEFDLWYADSCFPDARLKAILDYTNLQIKNDIKQTLHDYGFRFLLRFSQEYVAAWAILPTPYDYLKDKKDEKKCKLSYHIGRYDPLGGFKTYSTGCVFGKSMQHCFDKLMNIETKLPKDNQILINPKTLDNLYRTHKREKYLMYKEGLI